MEDIYKSNEFVIHKSIQNQSSLLTQSKSNTKITRSMHGKFNCITIKYNRTQNGIYIILEFHLEIR